MNAWLARFCATVTALGVLIVGATCSAAGCTLPLAGAKSGQPAPACCADAPPPSPDTSQPAQPKEQCPACHNPFLIGKTVEKVGMPGLAPLSPCFHTASCLVSLFMPRSYGADDGLRQCPFPDSSTLLALHCALLN